MGYYSSSSPVGWVASAVLVVGCAGATRAIAQGGEEVVLPQLNLLFSAVDIPVMLGIALVSYAIYRSHAISDRWGDLVALVLGALYGAVEGLSSPHPQLMILKGLFVNGGAAWLMAVLARRALRNILPPTVP